MGFNSAFKGLKDTAHLTTKFKDFDESCNLPRNKVSHIKYPIFIPPFCCMFQLNTAVHKLYLLCTFSQQISAAKDI